MLQGKTEYFSMKLSILSFESKADSAVNSVLMLRKSLESIIVYVDSQLCGGL
jgi:hypothetical protein